MYRVADFMTVDPVCLTDAHSLFEGRATMKEHSIRHVPIVNATTENFEGVLTQKAVLSHAIEIINEQGLDNLEEYEKKQSIADILDEKAITVAPETPLIDAAKFFRNNRHGCIVVVDEFKVVGILTSGDFVKFAIKTLEQ
ncbi:CBS domain-containing protein [Pleionea sediminis]|uniref:CBS domain-containing protein n=1 Tax=Pleionea sediminis TaxID=2569479 RepID=UPI0011859675|nr:CBS domain-containing protein [Pleionea sediminis]